MHLCLRTLAAAAAVCSLLGSAVAAPPRYPDILPIDQIRPGMKGYGLTVFRGARIERFDVEVVGVVRKGSLVAPGHDMILVRMAGGPMTLREANLIRGMSGSPVYVGGKIIGAFSQGEPTTKEPLGGVTPIEDMLEAWDPKLPTKPLGMVEPTRRVAALAHPLHAGGRTISRIIYDGVIRSSLRSTGSDLVLRPCTTFVTTSGLGSRSRSRLARFLEPYHVEVMQGAGGAAPKQANSPLVPGAAFGMMLMTGDTTAGATGTVTYRRGDRILGFGHPFLGIGAISAPICSAWVYDVYPLTSGSYKISGPGPVVGASLQDRNFSVSAVVGPKPDMVPVVTTVRDITTGRARTFRANVVNHPNLTAGMVSLAVGSAVTEIRGTPGPAMARVKTHVEAEELGTIDRTDAEFDARSIDLAATSDLDDILGVLSSNPFYPLAVRSVRVDVEIESGRKTAALERAFVRSGRVEPGDTAEIGVVLRPYRQAPVTRYVKLTVPKWAPAGRLMIVARGGAAAPAISIGGLTLRPPSGGATQQAPPANVRQMMDQLLEREHGTEIGIRASYPTPSVSIEGERITGLPPHIDAAFRSSRSSGFRADPLEIRSTLQTDWLVTGQVVLALNVQRPDQAPPVKAPSAGGGAPPPGPGPAAGFEFAASQGTPRRDARRAAPPQAPVAPSKSAPAKGAPSSTQPAPTEQPAAPGPADAPVGRVVQTWRQTASDLAKGKLTGMTLAPDSVLRPADVVSRHAQTDQTGLWAITPDGAGGVFAGGGVRASVLRIGPDGTVKTVADLPEAAVLSVARTADGRLYAGTSPHGRTYVIAADGTFSVAHTSDDPHVLALAAAPDGSVIVGTGGGRGTVVRLKDGRSETILTSAGDSVCSLAVDGSGTVYAGSSPTGMVYKIAPGVRPTIVLDSAQPAVSGLAIDPKGRVLACTTPQGAVYRIAPDGTSEVLYEKAAAGLTGIACTADGRIAAVGPGLVVGIAEGAPSAAPAFGPTGVDYAAVAAIGSDFAIASTNPGDLYRLAPPANGTLPTIETTVLDAKVAATWGRLRVTGDAGKAETRSGASSSPDATWEPWVTVSGQSSDGRITSKPARYLQVRLTMPSGQRNAIRDLTATYLTRNQPPKVTLQAPAGGERWSGAQTVRWSGVDPDKDTLSYDLTYSTDGRTWLPAPASAPATAPKPTAPSGPTPVAPAPAGGDRRGRPLSVAQVTSVLDEHPDLPTGLRNAILERTKDLNANPPAGPAPAPPAAPAAAPASTRQTTSTVDTAKLPDGAIRFRVVASDGAANPDGALTAESVSETVIVCNAPPMVTLLGPAPVVSADKRTKLDVVAIQRLVDITAAQWRADGGEWMAAASADGMFDGGVERFVVTTGVLAVGKHTIEVKVFNSAGLSTVEKVDVEVK